MINLFDEIYIDLDPYNYIVKRKTIDRNTKKPKMVLNKETGEMENVYTILAYHSKLEFALISAREFLQKRKFKDERAKLDDVAKYVEKCNKEIIKEIKKLNKK